MKKVISILLAVLLIVSMVSVALISAGAEETDTTPTEQTVWFDSAGFNTDMWTGTDAALADINASGGIAPDGSSSATLTSVGTYNLGNAFLASVKCTVGYNLGGDSFAITVGDLKAKVSINSTSSLTISLLKSDVVIKELVLSNQTMANGHNAFLELTYADGNATVSYNDFTLTAAVSDVVTNAVGLSAYVLSSYSACVMNGYTLRQIEYHNGLSVKYFDKTDLNDTDWYGDTAYLNANAQLAPNSSNIAKITSVDAYNLGDVWVASVDAANWNANNHYANSFRLKVGSLEARLVDWITGSTAKLNLYNNEVLVDSIDTGISSGTISGTLTLSYKQGNVILKYNDFVIEAMIENEDFSLVRPMLSCRGNYVSNSVVHIFSLSNTGRLNTSVSGALNPDMWTPSDIINSDGMVTIVDGQTKSLTSVNNYNLGDDWTAEATYTVTGYWDQMNHKKAILTVGDIKAISYNAKVETVDGAKTITEPGYIELYIKGELADTCNDIVYGKDGLLNLNLKIDYYKGAIKVSYYLGAKPNYVVAITRNVAVDDISFADASLSLSNTGDYNANACKIKTFYLRTADSKGAALTKAIDKDIVADDFTGSTDQIADGTFSIPSNKGSIYSITTKQAYDLSDGFIFTTMAHPHSGWGNWYGHYHGLKFGTVELRIQNIADDYGFTYDIYDDGVKVASTARISQDYVNGNVVVIYENGAVTVMKDGEAILSNVAVSARGIKSSNISYRIAAHWSDSSSYFNGFRLTPLYGIQDVNLSLGEDLGVNFYGYAVPTKQIQMRFSMTGPQPNEQVVDFDSDYGAPGDYKFFYDGVAPQNLSETINVELLSDGEVVSQNEFSIKDYLDAIKLPENKEFVMSHSSINNSQEKYEAMILLADDLICYGAAAQTYLGDKYTGATISTAGTNPSEYTTIDSSEMVRNINNAVDKCVTWRSANLVFDSVNQIKIKLSLAEGESIDSYVFKYKVGEGVEQAVEAVKNGEFYYLVTDDIFATDFDAVYTFSAYKADDEATAIATLTYSVKSYVISKQGSTVTGLADLVKALWNYGESAKLFKAADAAV